ncbi:glycosyltransferase family 1 protein [Patellaria atrata CBS 101060]|uniref:UDP-N-acetylglucosamine transferase subunit ALG14 n=1 Tax=Patellaria atrata CBS 101060 TaxID=1346257 RepID=A0A9P4SFE5_9PEZI|nr:glycosyltransferase family 1 protein [Patellaria atrata CBS 101060]
MQSRRFIILSLPIYFCGLTVLLTNQNGLISAPDRYKVFVFLFLLALFLVNLIDLRLCYLLPSARRDQIRPRRRGSPTHLLIVLGSGGHTAEMLAMLNELDCKGLNFRTYIVSSGDAFSARKAREFEEGLALRAAQNSEEGFYVIHTIPRARRIHQSLLTTPFSCLWCLNSALRILSTGPPPSKNTQGHPRFPNVILTNGPATAVIVILASYILRFFNIGSCNSVGSMRTIYVESWARVKQLSLSGRLLLRFVDRFLVQWEQLLPATGGIGEYHGWLI